MLKYKINVLEKLVDAGYNTYRLLKEKLLSESSIQFLRNGKMVSIKSLECICRLLKLQPGDIIEYIDDKK